MARYKYRDISLTADAGNRFLVVPNPELTIYEPGTTTPIAQTIYADLGGVTTKTNPFVGDADGSFEFFLATGQRVSIQHDGTASGYGVKTVDHEPVQPDPAEIIKQSNPSAVVFDGYAGSGHSLVARNTYSGIRAINVTAAGTGYTSTPTVSIGGGGGLGATATAVRSGTTVASITVTNPGVGYTSAPTVTISGGGGSGAAAVADAGDSHLLVQDRAGTTAFEVGHLGGGGPYAGLNGAYLNTAVGPFVVSNGFRNWNDGADMFVAIARLTGTVTGSHQAVNFSYQTCATPSDGFNGSANIPDHVVANFDYFAQNIASGASQNHDGSGRAIEIQTIVYQSTGKKRTMGAMSAGIHTAVDQISGLDVILAGSGTADTEYGSVGLYVHTGQQPYTGYGTGVRANTAFLAWGNPGYKQGFAYLDTDNSLLWCIDKFGDSYSRNLLPRPGASPTLGTSARIWSQAWASVLIAGNGSAANPSQAFVGAGGSDSGLFGSASGSLVGVGIAGTEKARFDASGVQFTAAERFGGAAIITPTQITSNQNNYAPTGLATARLLRLSSDAARDITGIAAQTGGTMLCLQNFGSFAITLKHQSASSTAANRFNGPSAADVVIPLLGSIQIIYDAGTAGWFKYGT